MKRSFLQFIAKRLCSNYRGSVLLYALIFGSVAFTVIVGGVSGYALFEHRVSLKKHVRDSAFHVAEAGVEYYRWHLAHDPDDYQDGTGQPGPYVHDYEDKDGNVIGRFSLDITQPPAGGHIVIIESTGWLLSDPDITRTIRVRIGRRALTDFAFIDDTNMRFSPTTEVHGKVHSNGGIEFNGTTDAEVQSAMETYYSGGWHPGVWGTGGPTEFWEYPVPEKDFDGVSVNIANMLTEAQNGGVELTSSGDDGQHIVFQADGTFDVYTVNSVNCYGGSGRWRWWWGWYWDGDLNCYDIGTETFDQTYTIPSNGAIFVHDHVWVDGVVNGRVTIAAGRFPESESNDRDIYISGNILYNEKNSDDVLGLLAQGDIIVPRNVPDDMEIDAAALAQDGELGRPYYSSSYSGPTPVVRNSLLFYGSQISKEGGGWKWSSGGSIISGFVNTNHTYDGNLLYNPPPGFPVENTYEMISWEEI